MDISKVLSRRTDLSEFLVHLTRDIDGGNSAKENLISILKEKKLRAQNYECLFYHKLKSENLDIQNIFKTTSFTETPLDKLHLLTEISKRSKNLKPYGLIFKKKLIKSNSGNPVFYLNSENKEITEYLWNLYNEFIKDPIKNKNFPSFGSRINFVKENVIDFYWEREWKTCGNLEFRYDDIIAIVCPEEEQLSLKSYLHVMSENGQLIPDIEKEPCYDETGEFYAERNMYIYIWNKMITIDITWSLEQIILKLSHKIDDPSFDSKEPNEKFQLGTSKPFL